MQVLRIIELQRSALSSKDVRLEVKLSEDYSLLVQFTIRETMRDMKLQQEEEGLGLSTYPCTLCDADKEAIKDPEHIQRGFPINRSIDILHRAGHMARINPTNLNRDQLGARLKGSKAVPLTEEDQGTANKSFETLHFKLSMGRFFKNILVRVNAGIFVWQIDQTLRPSFQPHEDRLERQLCRVLGIQQRLSMQGNEVYK